MLPDSLSSSFLKNMFSSRSGIITAGAIIGVLAALLQKFGNPPNMGICVACFGRDITGSIGLNRADVVQYLRPEIIGLVFGSLMASYLFREFRSRAGSAPVVGRSRFAEKNPLARLTLKCNLTPSKRGIQPRIVRLQRYGIIIRVNVQTQLPDAPQAP